MGGRGRKAGRGQGSLPVWCWLCHSLAPMINSTIYELFLWWGKLGAGGKQECWTPVLCAPGELLDESLGSFSARFPCLIP